MCGIVGVMAKYKSGLFQGQIDMFQQLFLVDQIRGTDGAGIITNDNKGISYYKAPYGAGGFMAQPTFKEAMKLAVKEGHFIIGHNRAATKGEHIWQNTHPFKEGSITLVHNGTLFDHKNLDKDVVVDSHAICKHMAVNGAEATLKEIDGAFALVWVNEEDNTINMARNKERPLHLIETASCWIISSELGLGLWMAERHKLTVVKSFQLETETLYTFDIDSLDKFTTKQVEYYDWKVLWKGNKSNNSNYGSWFTSGMEGGVGNEEATTPFTSRRQKHLQNKKKKQKEETDNFRGANVVTFPSLPKKEVVPPTRGYGTKIKFSPNQIYPDKPNSAIIFDDSRNKNFLLGKVAGEPYTEVRIYSKFSDLQEFAANDVLEGTISYTKIRGKNTSYQVENVKIIPTFPLLEVATNELALQKYCDNNGISNEPNALLKCDCCSSPVLRKEVTMMKGKPLCDTCHTAFYNDKKLAVEFGYLEHD